MKKFLKYFIENIQFSLVILFVVFVFGLSIFLALSILEFIATTISAPILAIIASALTLLVILSLVMTVFDMVAQWKRK